MRSWRDRARPIVKRALEETAGKPEKEIRAALLAAYPFGARQYHPYKIWLDEIRRQRGTKPAHPPCACGHGFGGHRGRCHAADCSCTKYRPGNPAQAELALPGMRVRSGVRAGDFVAGPRAGGGLSGLAFFGLATRS